MTDPAVTPAPAAVPAAFAPDGEAPKRGFGITSLVLGILLVAGVALWLLVGASLWIALVWVFPLVVAAAFIIATIHLMVAVTAGIFGVLAIIRDRGRVMGIVGMVLNLVATAAIVLVGFFFVQTMGVLGY